RPAPDFHYDAQGIILTTARLVFQEMALTDDSTRSGTGFSLSAHSPCRGQTKACPTINAAGLRKAESARSIPSPALSLAVLPIRLPATAARRRSFAQSGASPLRPSRAW